MIYLDNSSTTKPLPQVADYIHEQLTSLDGFGNPGSLHRLGTKAQKYQTDALGTIANLLGCQPQELIVTSCGSESINTAIRGYLEANKRAGQHVISTGVEHKATLESLRVLTESGYEVTYLPVLGDGSIDLDMLSQAIRPDTALITLTHVNNETGAILPVEQIVAIKNQMNPKTRIHLDCVQSLGKIPISLRQLNIDMASFSGHKIHSVKGVGLLYVKKACRIKPLIYGGGQQLGLRSGTQCPYLTGAMALALELAVKDTEQALVRVTELKQLLIEGLSDLHPTINSPAAALPYIVNLSFPGFAAETMLHALEEQEVYISTVSACSSRQKKASHVLTAMGISDQIARNSVRISFSRFSTREEIMAACQIVHHIYQKYKVNR